MSAKILTLDEAAKEMAVDFIKNGRGTQAVHETVVALRANRRSGTHCVKTKATVQKSGSKPWRQKGTGRARAGYAASPIWRGGGVVFGPHPRDYSKTVPKKVRQLALKKALGERIRSGDVIVVEAIKLEAPKTKFFIEALKKGGVVGSVLVVVDKYDEMLLQASRNVSEKLATVVMADLVNTEQLLRYKKILMTQASLGVVGKRLA